MGLIKRVLVKIGNVFDMIAYPLVVVGGLAWGGIAFFNYNFVEGLLNYGMLPQIIYGLVGVSAVYSFKFIKKIFN